MRARLVMGIYAICFLFDRILRRVSENLVVLQYIRIGELDLSYSSFAEIAVQI